MKSKITRRDFLKLAATGATGLALTACGVNPTEFPTAISIPPTGAPLPTETLMPTATPKPPETLRDFADILGIKVGTYIDPNSRFWENPNWLKVASREFNLAVNSIFWHILLPSENKYDFGLPDAQVEFAVKNQMEIRGESLVHSTFLPDWVKNGSFSREQLIDIFQRIIPKFINRYKGKIGTWVVVNEAGFIYRGWDFFETHIGKDYVQIAFEMARNTDPSINLIYNDYGNESLKGVKYEQTIQIIKDLRKQNLIDGIGLEMHIEPVIDDPTKFIAQAGGSRYVVSLEDFAQTIKSYEIPVHITELDVDLRNIDKNQTDRFDLQAKLYGTIIETIIKSDVCNQITFWGFGDKYSWLELAAFNGSNLADPTLFDDDLQPKPSYYSVKEVLEKYVNGK